MGALVLVTDAGVLLGSLELVTFGFVEPVIMVIMGALVTDAGVLVLSLEFVPFGVVDAGNMVEVILTGHVQEQLQQ